MSQVQGSQARAGTGRSRSADVSAAGRAAAIEALAPLTGEPPALVMVCCTPRCDLPRLLAGVRAVTVEALLVGCTGSGELVGGQHLGFSGGVGALAMTAGPGRFGVASASDLVGDLDEAGRSLARACRAQAGSRPPPVPCRPSASTAAGSSPAPRRWRPRGVRKKEESARPARTSSPRRGRLAGPARPAASVAPPEVRSRQVAERRAKR
jgi:hypothetical protein